MKVSDALPGLRTGVGASTDSADQQRASLPWGSHRLRRCDSTRLCRPVVHEPRAAHHDLVSIRTIARG